MKSINSNQKISDVDIAFLRSSRTAPFVFSTWEDFMFAYNTAQKDVNEPVMGVYRKTRCSTFRECIIHGTVTQEVVIDDIDFIKVDFSALKGFEKIVFNLETCTFYECNFGNNRFKSTENRRNSSPVAEEVVLEPWESVSNQPSQRFPEGRDDEIFPSDSCSVVYSIVTNRNTLFAVSRGPSYAALNSRNLSLLSSDSDDSLLSATSMERMSLAKFPSLPENQSSLAGWGTSSHVSKLSSI